LELELGRFMVIQGQRSCANR